MFSLILVSFIAGVLTILAPCVLPVLPVILAGSLGEKKSSYALVITISLAVSIVLFTILLKASTLLIDIPSSFWKYVSGGILLFLGLIYLFPHIWSWIVAKCRFSKSNESLDKIQNISHPLTRAILTGAALGPVFSTCSPTYTLLLATVFPVSFLSGIGYTLIYALGLSIMLFLIALGGRKLITHFRGIASENGWFKKILGIILVLVGISILFGFDKKLEAAVLNTWDVPSIETSVLTFLHLSPSMNTSSL